MIAESVRRRIVLKAERRGSEKILRFFSLETQRIPKRFSIYYRAESKGDPTP